MPRITVAAGPQKGLVVEFEDEALIGRASNNLIRLEGTQVSRNHARISRKGNQYYVTDLESRNGVIVDGKAAEEAVLGAGSEIRIGSSLLRFDCTESEEKAVSEREAVIVTEDGSATGVISTAFDAGEASIDDMSARDGDDIEKLRKAHGRLRVLYEAGIIINSVLDMDTVLRRLLESVMGILEADRGIVMLRGGSPSDYYPGAVKVKEGCEASITLSKTILNRVVKHGKAILSSDALGDPRFGKSESIQLGDVRSVMCVPLICRKNTLGALYVDKTKPYRAFEEDDLRLLATISSQAAVAIENARMYSAAREENVNLRRIVSEKSRLVFASKAMRGVMEAVDKIAHTGSTVLIRGETGTGKEVVARLIHQKSPRSEKPMICVNCAAVPEPLLESELFGHEKGAFTGAVGRHPGMFELADGGTLFLDEIGEMPLPIQTKLLRAIEEKKFMRVGGVENISVDVRIIAASNRDLESETEAGRFRSDLYYRLAVVPLEIPPLRERPEDVPELLSFFLGSYNKETGKKIEGFSDRALAALMSYHWPGNVRELRNLVEQAVVMSDGPIVGIDDLPERVAAGTAAPGSARPAGGSSLNLPEIIEETEKLSIERALRKAGFKKIEAARLLNVSRPTLDKKIKKYGIDVGRE